MKWIENEISVTVSDGTLELDSSLGFDEKPESLIKFLLDQTIEKCRGDRPATGAQGDLRGRSNR